MNIPQRLQDDLKKQPSWTKLKKELQKLPSSSQKLYDHLIALVSHIEQDPEEQQWLDRLNDQERAAATLPGGYAYTHQVLMPALLPSLPDHPDGSLARRADPAWLEREHPSALFLYFTSLMLNPISAVGVSLEQATQRFSEQLEQLCRLQPPITHLGLSNKSPSTHEIAAPSAWATLRLASLTHLELDAAFAPAHGIFTLLEALPQLHALNTFKLKLLNVTAHALERVELPKLPGLSNLSIELSHCEEAIAQQLLSRLLAPGINTLTLIENTMPSAKLDLLAMSAELLPASLKRLNLRVFEGACALDRLTANPTLRLTQLSVSAARLERASLQALLTSHICERLTALELPFTSLTSASAHDIAQSASLSALRALDLRGNSIDLAGALALYEATQRGPLQRLDSLNLKQNQLNISSLEELKAMQEAQQPPAEQLDALKALFQQPPSAQLWEQLVALCDAWTQPEALEQHAIPYALEQLEAWPDALRVAPMRWLSALNHGERLPKLRLARSFKLETFSGDVNTLIQRIHDAPEVEQITILELSYISPNAQAIQTIISSPKLQNIHTLTIDDGWYIPSCEQNYTLFDATWARLKHLSILGDGFDASVAQLRERPWMLTLEHLIVKGSPEDEALFNLDDLLLAPQPLALRSLSLTALELDDAQALECWRSEQLPQLKHLNIYNSVLSPELLEIIVDSEVIANLSELNAGSTMILSEQIELLSQREDISLTELDLSYNELDLAAINALLSSPWAANLTSLKLDHNQLYELEALIFEPFTQAPLNLKTLGLSDMSLSHEQLSALAQCAWLSKLRTLSLSENPIGGSEGLKALLQSIYLPPQLSIELEGVDLDQEEERLIEQNPAIERTKQSRR